MFRSNCAIIPLRPIPVPGGTGACRTPTRPPKKDQAGSLPASERVRAVLAARVTKVRAVLAAHVTKVRAVLAAPADCGTPSLADRLAPLARAQIFSSTGTLACAVLRRRTLAAGPATNPSRMNTYAERTSNPFRMRTCKNALCKSRGMNTYKKGGRGGRIMLRIRASSFIQREGKMGTGGPAQPGGKPERRFRNGTAPKRDGARGSLLAGVVPS